jgi:hypothetical protein
MIKDDILTKKGPQKNRQQTIKILAKKYQCFSVFFASEPPKIVAPVW